MGGFGKGYMSFIDPLGIFGSHSEAPKQPTIQEPAVDTAVLSGGQKTAGTQELLNTTGGAEGVLNPASTTRQSILGNGSTGATAQGGAS